MKMVLRSTSDGEKSLSSKEVGKGIARTSSSLLLHKEQAVKEQQFARYQLQFLRTLLHFLHSSNLVTMGYSLFRLHFFTPCGFIRYHTEFCVVRPLTDE